MTTRREFITAALGAAAAGAAAAGASGAARGGAAPVRFGFITDCHYAPHIAPQPGEERRYRESLVKLRAFVETMNAHRPDFVVEGGDFKDLGRTPAESLAYLDAMEAAFARFDGPRHHVLGNHDHDNLTKEEFLSHVSNAGQTRAKAWYSFDVRGIRFIVLDACHRRDGTPYRRGNFFWKDAFVPDEQVAFLEAELASAPGPCVPLVHQQLDAEDETCIANAARIRRLLEASGKVRCVVQGHLHEGSCRTKNGIVYFTGEASVLGAAPARNAFYEVTIRPTGEADVRRFNPPGARGGRDEARSSREGRNLLRPRCPFRGFGTLCA